MSRTVSTLKFVGTISLGLLTGLSYTLSTITLPTLLTLPNASTASRAFTNLSGRALTQLRILATLSGSSFFLAFALSPLSQKHPYLLWTTLTVMCSSGADYVLRRTSAQSINAHMQKRAVETDRKGKGKAVGRQQMDASFEVVSSGVGDSNSEGTGSGEEEIEGGVKVNGEEVRLAMEGFTLSQMVRTGVAGLAFAMSVVGIWGDGAPESLIVMEM